MYCPTIEGRSAAGREPHPQSPRRQQTAGLAQKLEIHDMELPSGRPRLQRDATCPRPAEPSLLTTASRVGGSGYRLCRSGTYGGKRVRLGSGVAAKTVYGPVSLWEQSLAYLNPHDGTQLLRPDRESLRAGLATDTVAEGRNGTRGPRKHPARGCSPAPPVFSDPQRDQRTAKVPLVTP